MSAACRSAMALRALPRSSWAEAMSYEELGIDAELVEEMTQNDMHGTMATPCPALSRVMRGHDASCVSSSPAYRIGTALLASLSRIVPEQRSIQVLLLLASRPPARVLDKAQRLAKRTGVRVATLCRKPRARPQLLIGSVRQAAELIVTGNLDAASVQMLVIEAESTFTPECWKQVLGTVRGIPAAAQIFALTACDSFSVESLRHADATSDATEAASLPEELSCFEAEASQEALPAASLDCAASTSLEASVASSMCPVAARSGGVTAPDATAMSELNGVALSEMPSVGVGFCPTIEE